jgi:RimJ/RimL family protein N-acetyltransferase
MEFDHYHIRQLEANDAEAYFRLIDTNRKRLEDFFAGTVAITHTLHETKIHLSNILTQASQHNYFPFVVIENNTHAIIASIQVKNIDWNIPKAELGYYIDSAYEGKGIVTKALALIIKYCFTDLKMARLLIRTHPQNISSIQVAIKNGFQLEGTIRKDYKTTSGQLVDLLYYGLLNEG